MHFWLKRYAGSRCITTRSSVVEYSGNPDICTTTIPASQIEAQEAEI